MTFEIRTDLLGLSGVDFGGPLLILAGWRGLFPLEQVAEVFEAVKFDGVVDGGHAVLVRAQRAHALGEKLFEHFEVLALHGEGECVVPPVVDDEAGQVLVTDEVKVAFDHHMRQINLQRRLSKLHLPGRGVRRHHMGGVKHGQGHIS